MSLYRNNFFQSITRAFTLLEVLLATLWFAFLMIIVLQFYVRMIALKNDIDARQLLIQNSYYIVERLQVFFRDYTIDYEEYFARRVLWCSSIGDDRIVSNQWYCTQFTHYGNRSFLDSPDQWKHQFYYCSSLLVDSEEIPDRVIWLKNSSDNDKKFLAWSWCYLFDVSIGSSFQSFWQYKYQFIDVGNDVDTVQWPVGDDDDKDLGRWPAAIASTTGVQELYLISEDATRRIFLRRALVDSGDRNRDGLISWDNEHLYVIQMLRLRSFDAWSLKNHPFDVNNNSGIYDGVIDTWVCDYWEWFICSWDPLPSPYSGYRFPADGNDGRVDVFWKDVTISSWNIQIYPSINPQYGRDMNEIQFNPYIVLTFQAKLYGEPWYRRLRDSINQYQLRLQTVFNTKNFFE